MTEHGPLFVPSQKRPKRALICFTIFFAAMLVMMCFHPFAGVDTKKPGWLAATMIFFGIVAFASLAAYPIYRTQARLARESVQRIETGQYLVRWSYSPEFWTNWRQQTHTSAKQIALYALIMLVFIVILFVAVVAYANTQGNAGSRQMTFWVGTIVLLIFSLILLAMLARAFLWKEPLRPRAAYITRDAVYIDGIIGAYADPWYPLHSVAFQAKPMAHIDFCFRHSGGRTASTYIYRKVPVFPGDESLAHQIVAVLHHTYLAIA